MHPGIQPSLMFMAGAKLRAQFGVLPCVVKRVLSVARVPNDDRRIIAAIVTDLKGQDVTVAARSARAYLVEQQWTAWQDGIERLTPCDFGGADDSTIGTNPENETAAPELGNGIFFAPPVVPAQADPYLNGINP